MHLADTFIQTLLALLWKQTFFHRFMHPWESNLDLGVFVCIYFQIKMRAVRTHFGLVILTTQCVIECLCSQYWILLILCTCGLPYVCLCVCVQKHNEDMLKDTGPQSITVHAICVSSPFAPLHYHKEWFGNDRCKWLSSLLSLTAFSSLSFSLSTATGSD